MLAKPAHGHTHHTAVCSMRTQLRTYMHCSDLVQTVHATATNSGHSILHTQCSGLKTSTINAATATSNTSHVSTPHAGPSRAQPCMPAHRPNRQHTRHTCTQQSCMQIVHPYTLPNQPTVLETDTPAPITQNQTCLNPCSGTQPRLQQGGPTTPGTCPEEVNPPKQQQHHPRCRRLLHCCAGSALGCCAGRHITPWTAVLAGASLLGLLCWQAHHSLVHE
jgi:hypothetical protein